VEEVQAGEFHPYKPKIADCRARRIFEKKLGKEYRNRKAKAIYDKFFDLYSLKFGKYGIVVEGGSITVSTLLNGVTYTVLNAIDVLGVEDEVLMRASGLKILEEPYLRNLRSILDRGQKMRNPH